MAPLLHSRQSIGPFRAVSFWSPLAQSHFATVADSDGDFNGTCTTSQENIPLLVNENMCASWIPDVTSYCCGAVGGMLEQAMAGVRSGTNGSEEVVQGDDAAFEPVCVTTNYNDMLDCYKMTSETGCRSVAIAPWGVCNPREADTSRAKSQPSGGDSSGALGLHRHPSNAALLLLSLLTSSLLMAVHC